MYKKEVTGIKREAPNNKTGGGSTLTNTSNFNSRPIAIVERSIMSDRKSSDSSSTDKPQKPSPFKPSAFGANKSVFGGQQITPAFGNFNPAKTSRIDNLASVLAKKKKLENKIKKDASKNKSSEDFGEYSNIPKAFRPPSANSGNRSRSNSINTSINNSINTSMTSSDTSFGQNLGQTVETCKPKTPEVSPANVSKSPTLPISSQTSEATATPSIQTTQDLERFIKTQVEACISKMVDGGKINSKSVNNDIMETIKRQLVQKAALHVPQPQNIQNVAETSHKTIQQSDHQTNPLTNSPKKLPNREFGQPIQNINRQNKQNHPPLRNTPKNNSYKPQPQAISGQNMVKPKKTLQIQQNTGNPTQNLNEISLSQIHASNQIRANNQIFNSTVSKKARKEANTVASPPPLTQTVVPRKTMTVKPMPKSHGAQNCSITNDSPPMPKLVPKPNSNLNSSKNNHNSVKNSQIQQTKIPTSKQAQKTANKPAKPIKYVPNNPSNHSQISFNPNRFNTNSLNSNSKPPTYHPKTGVPVPPCLSKDYENTNKQPKITRVKCITKPVPMVEHLEQSQAEFWKTQGNSVKKNIRNNNQKATQNKAKVKQIVQNHQNGISNSAGVQKTPNSKNSQSSKNTNLSSTTQNKQSEPVVQIKINETFQLTVPKDTTEAIQQVTQGEEKVVNIYPDGRTTLELTVDKESNAAKLLTQLINKSEYDVRKIESKVVTYTVSPGGGLTAQNASLVMDGNVQKTGKVVRNPNMSQNLIGPNLNKVDQSLLKNETSQKSKNPEKSTPNKPSIQTPNSPVKPNQSPTSSFKKFNSSIIKIGKAVNVKKSPNLAPQTAVNPAQRNLLQKMQNTSLNKSNVEAKMTLQPKVQSETPKVKNNQASTKSVKKPKQLKPKKSQSAKVAEAARTQQSNTMSIDGISKNENIVQDETPNNKKNTNQSNNQTPTKITSKLASTPSPAPGRKGFKNPFAETETFTPPAPKTLGTTPERSRQTSGASTSSNDSLPRSVARLMSSTGCKLTMASYNLGKSRTRYRSGDSTSSEQSSSSKRDLSPSGRNQPNHGNHGNFNSVKTPPMGDRVHIRMPAMHISPLNAKTVKNRELKRLADTQEFSKAPISRNVAAPIKNNIYTTSKSTKRVKRENSSNPNYSELNTSILHSSNSVSNSTYSLKSEVEDKPAILDSDRYQRYKSVTKDDGEFEKDAITAEGFCADWLRKMVVPNVKINYRVKSSSGSVWRPVGKPTLRLVNEADKPDPQLHWCFDSIERPKHLEEGCSNLTRGDCILVKAGAHEDPYIGMINALWSDSSYGSEDLKVGLHWYYRAKDILAELPDIETTDKTSYLHHEAAVYASKHYDSISAASIEDKCNVLTTNEFSLYRKRCKLLNSKLCTPGMVNDKNLDVISLEAKREDDGCRVVDVEDICVFSVRDTPRARKNGANVRKSNVYFCPGMWDVKSKKLSTQVNEKTT